VARELQTHTIAGEAYTFGFLPTSVATETFTELAQLGVPTIMGAMQNLRGKEDMQVEEAVKGMDFVALGQALGQALQPKVVSRLMKVLCSVAMAPGSAQRLENEFYEDHFAGRPSLALQVAARAAEVNGARDFFASAVSLGGIVKKAALTQAPRA
jgi:hypothetical protein